MGNAILSKISIKAESYSTQLRSEAMFRMAKGASYCRDRGGMPFSDSRRGSSRREASSGCYALVATLRRWDSMCAAGICRASTCRGVKTVSDPAEWTNFLGDLDILVNMMPLTPKTRGLIDADVFRR